MLLKLCLYRLLRSTGRVPRSTRSATATAKRNGPTKPKVKPTLGSRPAVVGVESAPGMFRMLSSPSSAEDEQIDRILDAGAKKLFSSEEGREKVRDSSYDYDKTAEVMLEAAEESLNESEGPQNKQDAGTAHVGFIILYGPVT